MSSCDPPSLRGGSQCLGGAGRPLTSQHPACPWAAGQANGWVGLREVRLKEGLFPEDQSEGVFRCGKLILPALQFFPGT